MRIDLYRQMTLAIACCLDTTDAYVMLHQEYVDRFSTYYTEVFRTCKSESKAPPNVLDAMITFAIIEIPRRRDEDENGLKSAGEQGNSILYGLRSKKSEIIKTFLESNTSEMVTQLASRKEIQDKLKQMFRKSNKFRSTAANINDTRVAEIFVDFLEVFKKNSAHAFRWSGTFVRFVMYSFLRFYYSGSKQDIWASIREVDVTRLEVEQNIIQPQILSESQSDDFLIRDYVMRIAEANNLLFRHSGHNDDVHGIMYDIYYLMLCELVHRRVDAINAKFPEPILDFVDPMDRKDGVYGVRANKGIAAKITNAKELIPYIFDYVKSGKLSIANLSDLRNCCFSLGKRECEGRNCVWVDVQSGGETSHYLDTPSARDNYENFNTVLHGVLGVYSMMSSLESRGYGLVESYDSELFRDKSIIRYIDYYSSVQHIPMIKQLQEAEMDNKAYTDKLLDFQGMLYTYAGSAENGNANIKENRADALLHGFLVNPKIKRDDIPKTQYDKLHVFAEVLDSIPKCHYQFLMSLNKNARVGYMYSTWHDIPPTTVVLGRHCELYYNYYMRKNSDLAKYYLIGNGEVIADRKGLVPNIKWTLKDSLFTGFTLQTSDGKFENYGVYLPFEHGFFVYDNQDFNGMTEGPLVLSLDSIKSAVARSTLNGVPMFQFVPLYTELLSQGVYAEWVNKLGDAVSFPVEVGFVNINRKDIRKRLTNPRLVYPYSKYAETYYDWLSEVSQLEHSIIDLFKVMFVECVFWYSDTTLPVELRRNAKLVLNGLVSGDFNGTALNWILDGLDQQARLDNLNWHSTLSQKYTPVDKSVLNIVFGRTNVVSGAAVDNDNVFAVLEGLEDPAERFIAICNYVDTRLSFLVLLRDSISILLNVIPVELQSLVCELDSRFHIVETLYKFAGSIVSSGIKLTSQSAEQIRASITEMREVCMRRFSDLVKDLHEYTQSCENEIASLVDYNVGVQNDKFSRFEVWGEGFNLMESYQDIPELSELRKIATPDSSGFLKLHGGYFKCYNNSEGYFVHRSGRLLRDLGGEYKPVLLDIKGNPADLRLYRDILSRGLANV